MVIRSAGTPSAHSVPARSSSSMLLAGKRARPKPASTMRFCAVRLSIGTMSDASIPAAASVWANADT